VTGPDGAEVVAGEAVGETERVEVRYKVEVLWMVVTTVEVTSSWLRV